MFWRLSVHSGKTLGLRWISDDHDDDDDDDDAVSDSCSEVGFLKLTCDPGPDCEHLKWWSNDDSLQNAPCGVLYSRSKEPVVFKNAFWASKIQLLSGKILQWTKVLMMKSFSSVNALDAFFFAQANEETPPQTASTWIQFSVMQKFRARLKQPG